MKQLGLYFLLMWSFLPLNLAHAEKTLLAHYEEVMSANPPKEELMHSCVTPDLKSNRHAYQFRTTLMAKFRERKPQADFCARYFLFNQPTSGGAQLYLADCKTGRVQALNSGIASFSPLRKVDSCVFIENAPGTAETQENFNHSAYGPPRMYQWKSRKVIQLKDKIWPVKE